MNAIGQRDTLVSLFFRRVEADGPQPALWLCQQGSFRSLSWNEIAQDVRRAAAVLASLGVEPGDRVVQVSENRYEWIVSDLAIALARGVHVPVHASLTGAQIAYQIADCGARLVIVSTPAQAAKLADRAEAPVANGLPNGLRFLSYDAGCVAPDGKAITPLAEQMIDADDRGGRIADVLFTTALEQQQPDELATILYTSGTTGEPKGVMLSHRNLVSNAIGALAACRVQPGDVRLTWLPLSHIFARTCDLYSWIAAGAELALAESRESILANCAQVRPTLMNGVPYFFDKLRRLLLETPGADTPGKLQEILGGRMRFLCSGGAALPDHVAEFFRERGMLLVQGYGLTESSPVITFSTESEYKIGTVGRALEGVEVRIADDGEILARGPNIMLGYWNKPRDTAEVLHDGWLATGDLGELDDEGYLKITGRKKELIVTAAGKNIAPVYLESLLTEDPLIAQAVVIGDGRNYLTALVVPNFDALKHELAQHGLTFTYPLEWLEHDGVRELYAARVAKRLASLSPSEQVRKFTLLERPFTPESGELTPTLKLRRGIILERNAALIEKMYTE
jgi:long-chain acyl-CoA synthetase